MLLPNNVHPELSIYYNGALIIDELRENNLQTISNLYYKMRKKTEMSFPVFILCLDWLYLINIAEINGKGKVELCL